MNNRLIVKSETVTNRRFRPSDWVERLASSYAAFGADNRLHYQAGLTPVFINHEKCLSVDLALEETYPELWNYIMRFVLSNKLKTTIQHNDLKTTDDGFDKNEAA